LILLADHLRPTLGAGSVNATLPNQVWLFLPALGPNTITVRAGTGLIAATLAAANPAAFATKVLV